MLFRESAPNGPGAEYAHTNELRDAFWGAWNGSETTRVFFGVFMKAKWRPDGGYGKGSMEHLES